VSVRAHPEAARFVGFFEGEVQRCEAVSPAADRPMLGSMGYHATGRLHVIMDTEQKTERFRKRDFVVELSDNPRFPQYVLFQLTGDRCEAIDGFSAGEDVKVEFSLRGREWTSPSGEVRYFTSLDVWNVERAAEGPLGDEPPPPDEEPPPFGEPPF
jgi:hypothetical protein